LGIRKIASMGILFTGGRVAKKKSNVVQEIKVDVKKDIKKYLEKWPYSDESVSEITCNGVLEFIDGLDRAFFMDEVYRILKPGAKATIRVPYWNSVGGIQDYAYAWPPFCEASFCYFDKAQRESIGLTEDQRDIKCDFEVGFGYDVPSEIANKSEETRSFHIKHYSNTINFLNIVLTKRVKK
jgi:ubiquinone/menaquinone biosynthesis C-methylase UbiE